MIRRKDGKGDERNGVTGSEENAAVVRSFHKGMNAHDPSAAGLFAEGVVHHNPLPGRPPGRAGNERTMRVLFAAFPDWAVGVEEVVAAGDKFAVRTVQRGTHKGEFFGVAPTTMTL